MSVKVFNRNLTESESQQMEASGKYYAFSRCFHRSQHISYGKWSVDRGKREKTKFEPISKLFSLTLSVEESSLLHTTQLQHLLINHVMAKSLQRLYFKKGSLRWHLKVELLFNSTFFIAIFRNGKTYLF